VAFLSEQGEQRLGEAIAAVEARSRAELVVVVRPAAGSYLAHDLLIAIVVGLCTLAFLLYSPWVFGLHWFLIHPALAGAATVALLRAAPGLRAMFIGEARKRREAETAAAACFHTKGIRHTRERTGVLVYVASFEEQIVVLADSGITSFVPEDEWREAVAPIQALVHEGGDAVALAERLEALTELLERWCEVRDDDIDELPNAIDTGAAA
jgi:putative membrane protein